jgi:serine protease Do
MNDAPAETAAIGQQPALVTETFAMLAPTWPRSCQKGSAALLLALAVTGTACIRGDGLNTAGIAGEPMPSFAPVVQQVMPAVVNVSAVQRPSKLAEGEGERSPAALRGLPPSMLDELLRRFLDAQRQGHGATPTTASVALGSGFIIDPSGYIVTDDHVIDDAETVTIVFQDATEYPARIVGRDPPTDLALLKIEAARPLSYVRWGDSDTAHVGDWVLAIGSPFGLENTVSSGIISGRGRDLHSGPYDDFLQIDAAMNRGNSGGPTFDVKGDVIGVNTAIYSPNGGSVGIGFAIPANQAKPIVDQLKADGRVTRGWLGIRIDEVTPEIARGVGLPKAVGALVSKVGAGSPAALAGFAPGDVILSVNGRDIRRVHDLPLAIAEMPIGDLASVTVWRGSAAVGLRPVIGEMPVDPDGAPLRKGRPVERRSERTNARPLPASAASPACNVVAGCTTIGGVGL